MQANSQEIVCGSLQWIIEEDRGAACATLWDRRLRLSTTSLLKHAAQYSRIELAR